MLTHSVAAASTCHGPQWFKCSLLIKSIFTTIHLFNPAEYLVGWDKQHMSSTNNINNAHGAHGAPPVPALANANAKHEPSPMKDQITIILRLLRCFNFLTAPIRDGLGPLVSVYLVAEKGWDAGRAGIIWFTRDTTALLCQTFVGGFVDGFEKKRLLLFLATASASIAVSSMVFSQNFGFLIVKSIVEGVAFCFIQPCKNSVVLGVVDHKTFDEVTKANEMADHFGSFVFIIIAGVISYCLYPNNVGVFYVIGAGGLLACVSLMLMPLTISKGENDGNHPSTSSSNSNANGNGLGTQAQDSSRSSTSNTPGLSRTHTRSLLDQKSSRNLVGEEASSYLSIIKNKNIAIFASSVFFFHLGNAAVLPLLSQVVAIDSGRAGIPYTCANIAIAQVTSILAIWGMGHALKKGIPYKVSLIVGYFIAVPIRCFLIVLLLKVWPNTYALLAMQIFDGVGVGAFGLSLIVITKALTEGTGRFSFTLGFIITSWMIGAALSNLLFGYIANISYIWAFISLGITGCVSVVLTSFLDVKDNDHGQVGAVEEEDLAKKRRLDDAKEAWAEGISEDEEAKKGGYDGGGDLTQTTYHTADHTQTTHHTADLTQTTRHMEDM